MKVEIIDDNIIVFLNKYLTKDLDYQDLEILENELKNIFDKLNKYYDIVIKGYYDVTIYIDNNYGAIIELDEDDLGYIGDSDVIDMRIIVKNIKILYKIENMFIFNIPYNLYIYKGNMYIELLDNVDNITMGKILENSEVIYKNTSNILKYGKCLKNMKTML